MADEDDTSFNVVRRREEIKELLAEKKRKGEYVLRLEEMLAKRQDELGKERDEVERWQRQVMNERERHGLEEQSLKLSQDRKLVLQQNEIRRYLESALYQKTDQNALDTVKVTLARVDSHHGLPCEYLVYRIDDTTKVNAVRLDCCKYWALKEEDYIMNTDRNMKVADELIVQKAFAHGEVAQFYLRPKRLRRTAQEVSEAEITSIQPLASKQKVGAALEDPRQQATQVGRQQEALQGTGYEDEQRSMPGVRAMLRVREPKPTGHVKNMRCCDFVMYILIGCLTLALFFTRAPPGEAYWGLEGFRSTLVETARAAGAEADPAPDPLQGGAWTTPASAREDEAWGPAAALLRATAADRGGGVFHDIQQQDQVWDWLDSLADPLFDPDGMVYRYFVPVGFLRLRTQNAEAPPSNNLTKWCVRRSIVQMISPYAKCFQQEESGSFSFGGEPFPMERTDNSVLRELWSPDATATEFNPASDQGLNAKHGTFLPWKFGAEQSVKENSKGAPIPGSLGFSYAPSGFIVDYALAPVFPGMSAEQSLEEQKKRYRMELQMLRRGNYMSRATRVFVASFNCYSVHYQRWVAAEFLVEFPPSGRLVPYARIRFFKSSLSETKDDTAQLYMEELRFYIAVFYVLIFSVARGVSHKIQFRRAGLRYFLSLGGISDTLITACILASYILTHMTFRVEASKAKAVVEVLRNERKATDEALGDYEGFVDFSHEASTFETISILDGLVILFLCMRYLTFLRLNRRIYILWRSTGLALMHFLYALLLLFPTFFMFICIGHKLWGKDIPDFASSQRSLVTLLMLLNGRVDFRAMSAAQPVWTPIFLSLFFIFVMFLSCSLCVALSINAFYTVFITSAVDKEAPGVKWGKHEYLKFMLPSIVYKVLDSLQDHTKADTVG